MTAPILHLVCGKAASGKSTLSARLAEADGAVLLAEDALLSVLFGDAMVTLKDYAQCSARLKEAIRPLVLQLLARGIPVVLDFPANTVGQRDWLRGLIDEAGCAHKLHFLDVADDACKARLAERNRQGSHPFQLTERQFDEVTRHFIPPAADEGFDLVVHPA